MASISSQMNPASQRSHNAGLHKLENHSITKAQPLREKSAIFSDAMSSKIHDALSAHKTEFDTHLSEQIFAHVVGNGLLTSEHEGNIFSDSMAYAADELERVSEGQYGLGLGDEETQEIEQMQRELTRCEERMHKLYAIAGRSSGQKLSACDQMSHHLLREAADLKPGERLLIPGGWSSSVQGHAMLYELEKTSDGRILFHLFNSGDGLQYHPSRSQEGETKFLCHRTWDLGKASHAEESFNSVLNQLLQLRVGLAQNPSLSRVDDLYQTVLPKLSSLGAKELSAPSSDPCWMSEQKSAICTWQCIMAWKKSHMKPQTYERAKLCAKVRAFKQFALQYPEKLQASTKVRELAQQALAKTGRQLVEAGLDKALIGMENIEPSQEERVKFASKKSKVLSNSEQHRIGKFISRLFPWELPSYDFQQAPRKATPFSFSNIHWLEALWEKLLKLLQAQNIAHAKLRSIETDTSRERKAVSHQIQDPDKK